MTAPDALLCTEGVAVLPTFFQPFSSYGLSEGDAVFRQVGVAWLCGMGSG